ncbi:MAG: hypothetical protein AAGC77_11245 [Pseudomonadota bacterium]
MIQGFVDKVVICLGTEEIARHERSYERNDIVFNPLHYLALLERKPGAPARGARKESLAGFARRAGGAA